MNAANWPLRLIPSRQPPFWASAGVVLAALAAAIGIRVVFLGVSNSAGLSSTYLPAVAVVALYSGSRWAWPTLVLTVAFGYLTRLPGAQQISAAALTAMFALSGAVIVMVCASLRDTLVRLQQSQQDREQAQSEVARVERELDRRADRLRLAQDAAGVGIWDWDLASGEAYWSPTFFRNVGLSETPSEPSADLLLQACHPDDRERMREILRTAGRSGEFWETEYRVVHPDGSIRWLLARGEGVLDANGEPARFIGVNLDVTSHRAVEEQVRESEARFRALADSAPVMMWVTGQDGEREFVNLAYLDFMGLDYGAARALDWRERTHPADLAQLQADEAEGEAAGGIVVLQARYRRADGEWRWLRSFSRPRRDSTGALSGFIGIAFDVTDAKQAETDLKRINELLEERVAVALAERDVAQAALMRSQRLEAVGQLTGGVAHDFNNLLTVVVGALDMISRHPDDAPRRARMIDAALSAARRGERLTHQLLAFARRQPLKVERVVIDELVREIEPLLQRAVGEAVALSLAVNADQAAANIDPAQLEAALMNLVVNARDAVGANGSIRIETLLRALGEGEIEELAGGAYVCLAVHDTGEGMSPEVLQRVFEPFFTTKPVGKGTGLGLSQVYGFARQSGGGVVIDSTPGKGSSVRLLLPLTAEDTAPAPDPVEIGETRIAETLDVLLVEDDGEVAQLVSAMLEDLGHRVRHAADAAEAMRLIETPTRFDLMLTDLVMPGGKSGVDLAHEATHRRPGLPVILSSGYTGETLGLAEQAPWPLLRKPYDSEALLRFIAQAMERA